MSYHKEHRGQGAGAIAASGRAPRSAPAPMIRMRAQGLGAFTMIGMKPVVTAVRKTRGMLGGSSINVLDVINAVHAGPAPAPAPGATPRGGVISGSSSWGGSGGMNPLHPPMLPPPPPSYTPNTPPVTPVAMPGITAAAATAPLNQIGPFWTAPPAPVVQLPPEVDPVAIPDPPAAQTPSSFGKTALVIGGVALAYLLLRHRF